MKKFFTTFLLSFILLLFSCATIMKGTKQIVSISSNPASAKVKIKMDNGTLVFDGVAPVDLELSKKHTYKVIIELEGYETQEIFIDKGFEPWVLGNIICGGLIGIIVDFANGAANKLEPSTIHVQLVQATALNNGYETNELYAVVSVKDDHGKVKSLTVPMIRK